jgi:hypothetical protein
VDTESWLSLATRVDIVRRASRTAALVGTLLIAINYGDALLSGTVSMVQVLKMTLTVFVPYAVSTYSSVGALRAVARG